MDNKLFNSDFAKNSKFEYNFVGDITEIDKWNELATQYKKYLNEINHSQKNDSKIPNTIHQIWLGDKPLPKKSIKWINSWKKLNPEWEHKLWGEENIKELKITEFDVYSKKINPGYRSDILRYIILNKFGGVYVDTDFECLKSIPSDILQYKFIAGVMFGEKPFIGNSILMSHPNSLLLDRILNNIKSKNYKNDIKHIISSTGPNALTQDYFALPKEIKKECLILPSNYFYPYPNFMLNKQTNRYDEIEEISIGIHHWEMTWMKGNLFNRIKNKLQVYFN